MLPRFQHSVLKQTTRIQQIPFTSSTNSNTITKGHIASNGPNVKRIPKVLEVLNALMAIICYAKFGINVFPFEEKIPSLFQSNSNSSDDQPLFVDIGGGRGQMCCAFRARFPTLKGRVIFQDLPQTVAEAGPPTLGIEGMPHNFLAEQPIKGAKTYFLRYVLHDWPDEKAEAILHRVIEAMGLESFVLINEKVLQDIGTSNLVAGLDR